MSSLLACVCDAEKGQFPEYIKVFDLGDGQVEIVINEAGLLTPVAKIKLPLHAAKCFLFDAAHRVEDLYEESKL